jgi:acetate kinase
VIVLVFNVGSTSLKYRLYDMDAESVLVDGKVDRITSGKLDAAFAEVISRLPAGTKVDAVGHRVVHGGEELVAPTVVTPEVKQGIRDNAIFAPIHNPANLAGIEVAEQAFPEARHVAVFDTAFHGELPPHSYLYALPYEMYLERGLRRYGFHGPSHQYMAVCAAEHLGTDVSRLKLVTCHLGGGASVCAIDGGRSVDTSMGMTPLEGLVMGTRSGDVDPALALVLGRQGMSAQEIDDLLNRKSGLLGISGVSGDFRDVEGAAAEGNDRARLAIEVFVHRIKKYIGAYAAILGGADAICFTGGIGENSARVRQAVCEGLLYMGVALDARANESAKIREAPGGVLDVAEKRAPTRVLVVATDEERMIAREVTRTLLGPTAVHEGLRGGTIPIGVSVRHVHLSPADCAALFGEGVELAQKRNVSQPGQYVTRETVDLVGPKGEIQRVAIINPLRKETQVEVSRTDAFALGVNPPMRESGKLDGTPGITLRGPKGTVTIDKGVILAHRHVHMHPTDAQRFGVKDGSVVKVRAGGDREAVLGDVLVRVSDKYALDMHVDTDEANATGLTNDSVVRFEGIQ